MAGVFKSLDKSDIRIVPFRAHKQWVNDLSYTLTPAPIASVSLNGDELLHLRTSFSQSVNLKNNYYYYTGTNGNIYLVDGNDNYTVLAETTNNPYIYLPYTTLAGLYQNRIMYYNSSISSNAMCAHDATDLSDLDVDAFVLPLINYTHLSWIPGASMLLLSGEESAPTLGLTKIVWDEVGNKFDSSSFINTSPDTNYLGTTFAVRSGSSSNFFAAYVETSALDTVRFEYKTDSGSIIGSPSAGSTVAYSPLAVKDFVSNGDLANLSAFATMNGGIGLWLIKGSNTVEFAQYDLDVVRLLQDKDIYRNGSYTKPRTFAVLRDGIILTDLYANSTGYGWQDSIDARRWIGNGYIVGATINKNVDLIAPTKPLTITVYAVTSISIKAPIVVFSINLDTGEISDPIHLGSHHMEPNSPFMGDDGTVSINFFGENTADKVVGLMYQSDIVDAASGNVYNQIYTFNI